MRILLVSALLTLTGCQLLECHGPLTVESQVQTVVGVRAIADACPNIPTVSATPNLSGPLDLSTLWDLTIVNNPALRESAADVEAARGRLIQAGKYPNPRFLYDNDTIGSALARQGNFTFQVNQEIVTAGKLHLDKAVARKDTDVAATALLGRKFEVLTRVRRAYYDYLAWGNIVRVNDDIVAGLQRGVETTREKVETAKTSPLTELLRLEALLGEAKVSQTRSRVNLQAAWQQLAAEVGVDELPFNPSMSLDLPDTVPQWDAAIVRARVLAANTSLKEARLELERARLAAARAGAEAVPNVTVGGGYTLDNIDMTRGGVVAVETPLPVWDCKQGHIYEARANWARAEALVRSTATRLSRDVAETWARYEAARQEVERLQMEVLPKVQETVALLRKGYQAGAPSVSFNDLILTEQSFNTTRLSIAQARQTLWLAVTDLQGLMQLDVAEELSEAMPAMPLSRWVPAPPCQEQLPPGSP